MKLNNFVIATSLVLGMVSFANAAGVNTTTPTPTPTPPTDQGHGTVSFTGDIVASPCSIDPTTLDQTVSLGQISATQLADGGASRPANFQIKLENCNVKSLTDGDVTETFTGAAGVDGRLGISGTASGASIALTDGAGNLIKLGTATAPQKIQNGNNSLEFAAYLKGDDATGGIVPGEFNSIADFTLSYQ
ncbi:Pilin (type 1 fimbria component protein) [Izhakiella capsodis]|uniref:Pilin (Type 1 fimbria component protein) n=1 Tax=Izhakiella capsodis TaxID=1367852 RepID=A0A1I4ZYD0_9GAMM|nr:fimbrial protein [Izhakiella capsodis]SFN55191.1 Pilin (type 1 fimbria component protein) [Izhakiella capsodis]